VRDRRATIGGNPAGAGISRSRCSILRAKIFLTQLHDVVQAADSRRCCKMDGPPRNARNSRIGPICSELLRNRERLLPSLRKIFHLGGFGLLIFLQAIWFVIVGVILFQIKPDLEMAGWTSDLERFQSLAPDPSRIRSRPCKVYTFAQGDTQGKPKHDNQMHTS
jgi:hypothetical protein